MKMNVSRILFPLAWTSENELATRYAKIMFHEPSEGVTIISLVTALLR